MNFACERNESREKKEKEKLKFFVVVVCLFLVETIEEKVVK
jgi:hypothetical protein